MSLDQNKDHSIDLETAAKMTKRYRDKISSDDPIAVVFNKAAIAGIMDQADCVGMRMYYALDDDGSMTLVLVGVNEKDDDLYEGKLMEWSLPCPPCCAESNPLNS